MTEQFPVFDVQSDDAIHDEELGTKPKFWIEKDGSRWLFKEARANTGEDWSEKLAYEFARLIGIPAAKVELAQFERAKNGTQSLSFLNRSKGESLIHGNEILAGLVLGYDPYKRFGQSDHTLENIQQAVVKLFKDDIAKQELMLKRMASYLVLDALIINTDRHHENWGIIARQDIDASGRIMGREQEMAPTFDHASSLGRDLLDENIKRKYPTPQAVARYINKGPGAIYRSANSQKGENPLELVKLSCNRRPELFKDTLLALKAVPLKSFLSLVDRVPEERMSNLARQFVKTFIAYTYEQLCNLVT